MTGSRQDNLALGRPDWWSIAIYFALVIMGLVNIYAAVHIDQSPLFDLGQRYGMQMVWIGVSLCIAFLILLIDERYFYIFAYPLYILSILLLLFVLFFGKTVNGAKAWIQIGSIAVQPCEFVKLSTALALARFMSKYGFVINRFKDIATCFVIIGLPALIIILQNDTGSAVVYGAFLLVFYREGLKGWIFTLLIISVSLFLLSFLVTDMTILIILLAGCMVAEGMANGRWKQKFIYLSIIVLGGIAIWALFNLGLGKELSPYHSGLISTAMTSAMVIVYGYRNRLRNVYVYLLVFFGSIAFVSTVDYVFDNVMQTHQQKRILDLLGLESDPHGWGYNVIQSKIAIGSGGFLGKGFLSGTQTRFDFVPEQSTDFIFCTVGEEWGFVGTTTVILLFSLLIIRLMKMGERQREPFGRIYCYSVAAIFFAHVVINVGMTIGIMPVIGIPLPFFSYGGSSFLAFTLLFFIAVKMDMDKRELLRH